MLRAIDIAKMVAAINAADLPPRETARVTEKFNQFFAQELEGVVALTCKEGKASMSAVSTCATRLTGGCHEQEAGSGGVTGSH